MSLLRRLPWALSSLDSSGEGVSYEGPNWYASIMGTGIVVGQHEATHVAALKQVLGSKAVKKPKFNFRGTTESAGPFKATAQVLEDTGVSAYKGQAPLIKSDAVAAEAATRFVVPRRRDRPSPGDHPV
jgi:hypothetical protein